MHGSVEQHLHLIPTRYKGVLLKWRFTATLPGIFCNGKFPA